LPSPFKSATAIETGVVTANGEPAAGVERAIADAQEYIQIPGSIGDNQIGLAVVIEVAERRTRRSRTGSNGVDCGQESARRKPTTVCVMTLEIAAGNVPSPS